MDALFSCRNCIHNCGQTLSLGFGDGFCVKHDSVIENSDNTTCKYLHRKDLPYFVVDEGIREHASEYVFFTNMATLSDKKPLSLVKYSERHVWDNRRFSPIIHSLSQYHKMNPSWVFVQNFAGSADGIRAITHASLVRHYLDNCGNWKSSYRLILALLQEINLTPYISASQLVLNEASPQEEIKEDAFWEIIFSRLSALQEYGWHAGLEEITWITDQVNGSLTDFDWNSLSAELESIKVKYTDLIIKLAKNEQVYFPQSNYQDEYASI